MIAASGLKRSLESSSLEEWKAVLTNPGSTRETDTPRGPNSFRRESAKPSNERKSLDVGDQRSRELGHILCLTFKGMFRRAVGTCSIEFQ